MHPLFQCSRLSFTDRPARQTAHSIEGIPETRSTSESPPETKLQTSKEKSVATRAERAEKRSSLRRREAWERYCEEMADEQLLKTLGELHVKSEDIYQLLYATSESQKSERYSEISRQIDLVEEQLIRRAEVCAEAFVQSLDQQ